MVTDERRKLYWDLLDGGLEGTKLDLITTRELSEEIVEKLGETKARAVMTYIKLILQKGQ